MTLASRGEKLDHDVERRGRGELGSGIRPSAMVIGAPGRQASTISRGVGTREGAEGHEPRGIGVNGVGRHFRVCGWVQLEA